MINLEPLCAKYGHLMISEGHDASIKEKESTITKALGVLTENGLYAMCVFLLSCHKKNYGRWLLTDPLLKLWKEQGLNLLAANVSDKPAPILGGVRKVAEDLPKLILMRKVTEQALVFARYHAKAGVEFV